MPGPLETVARVTGFGYRHDAAEDAWCRVPASFAGHPAAAKR